MDDEVVQGGGHLFGTTFPSLLMDMLAIFVFVIWFWLMIRVMADMFRRSDISGFVKVMWVIFLIVLPYIGVFVYLLTQNSAMHDRDMKQAVLARDELRKVIGFSVSDEIRKLDQLKSEGSITEEEYKKLRASLI
ncbi:SHOCT domain-containing protein [Sedimentitalea sp. JM2-8]|uniref:SHOCT domain-containing protein n=1 Tax=Sedimentitalea xiamensis TaxID=3050037 RepID=A0ABT7FHR2_9RHOB|nr:SHOCT domain-containing protein [Sedimentitalea xiamensis]MDK3074672.1 SHOCT domain-containing protein [Sedimentitalea xiamensis]